MNHRGNESEAGFTDYTEITTPGSNPASGTLRLYSKSDDNVYTKNSAGVESRIGGGGTWTLYQTCTYVSDGDANGIFNFLGSTNGVWINPHTTGQLLISASNLAQGVLGSIVNRGTNNTFDDPLTNNWFGVNLGPSTLVVNKYSFQQRSATGNLMVTMKLQGSTDNVNWTDLTIADSPTQTVNVWTSFSVSTTTRYQYFRIMKTALDSSGGNFFTIGQWELYGSLYHLV